MSYKRRLEKLEQSHGNTDELVQQAIKIWGHMGIELSQDTAEQIAQCYRERGLSEITWESLINVSPDDMRLL